MFGKPNQTLKTLKTGHLGGGVLFDHALQQSSEQ